MTFWPNQIRRSLTFWYIAIFGGVLAAYICVACIVQYWQLSEQLYHAEIQDIETVQGLLYFNEDGKLLLHEDYFNRQQSRLLIDRMMEVLTPDGRVLFRSSQLHGNRLGGLPTPNEGVGGFTPRRLRLADGTHVLAISHVHSLGGTPLLIRIAYSTELLRQRTIELLGLLGLVLPAALIAAGLAGYRVAGKALDPLEQMAQLTEGITARRLGERIPVRNPEDELGHMARVLNDLLKRLEESFESLQRFTSDVAHELRTPLAAMRSVGEVGLQEKHGAEKYRDIIGSMLEEVAKLNSMVDTLLTLAHAESGAIELHRTIFPFMELVNESAAVVGVLAEEKNQAISVKGDSQINIWADYALVRMAVVNLLDNAVKYSPPGSAIWLSFHVDNGAARTTGFVDLDIEDEGPGIPENARERIFDRFFRLDEARTQDAGGAGLGLPIAKWAIEANGGRIFVKPGKVCGAKFSIRLPIADGYFDKVS
ncbi:MAG TPA: ATP-binding protein [Terracidiphilus sp.]|nr:ATP-binding protein [Terracidiphilus sp.]